MRPELMRAVLHGKIQRPHYYKLGEPYFPTLCSCPRCHGIHAACPVTLDDGTKLTPTPAEAYQFALLQHGTYLEKWAGSNVANATHCPTACDCACQHEWKELPQTEPFRHSYRCSKCSAEVIQNSED